ncbi:MAG: ABC transporter ATP-binding protein [Anaerolineaceae bacterium]|nr:ABC transporter ATP-binding protein [Anaerolineaceae bacterium]
MNAFVNVEHISLKFRIYKNPIPSLKEAAIKIFRGNRGDDVYEFHALKDISLQVRGGDRLGIIGLNGAGKSTLLKTIAGIYTPHAGRVVLHGRVTPLLELGAGFDPEQTGRDNIYLNGALLGYHPKVMAQREKSIVEFSELDTFINMPVKYYSSGMFGRLAFSIATMTQPDILLIDELFAAGDAHFVNKASIRLQQLIESSQIVVLVSHNMDQIVNLCNRVVVLKQGELVNDGPPQEMVDFYKKMIGQD